MQEEGTGAALEDCLRLLRGASDEHRLAGLLLATRLAQGDDKDAVVRIYDAVGPVFLTRLLKTGMMREGDSKKGPEEVAAYLRLSVTILAAFCRVTEIACSEDMISKVPLVLEAISKMSDPSIFEESVEFLLLVSMSSDEGLMKAYRHGVIKVLVSNVSTFADDSRPVELFIRIMQAIFNKLSLDIIIQENQSEMSTLVIIIARQFGALHTAIKFDALHLLATICSSEHAVEMRELRLSSNNIWTIHVRTGIIAVLQNRVAPEEKLHALSLADSMMSIVGEGWLLDLNKLPGDRNQLSVDKCLLLVLESARIEVAVLLNELAYLKYEKFGTCSSTETIILKQHSLAMLFSLIEKIIKVISNDIEGSPITEHTIIKAISGIDETICLVLDFLVDAKDHKQRKGDDLLASIRLLGSYLAEAPYACKEKVCNLLEYILSVEGNDEQRPSYSICFMLPMLSQITADENGCKSLISFGGHKSIVKFIVSTIFSGGTIAEDSGTMFLACETIKNLLLNKETIQDQLEISDLIRLLEALVFWTGNNNPSTIFSAACICILALEFTSEDEVLISNFDNDILGKLAQLVARGLVMSKQVDASTHDQETVELCRTIVAGYPRLVDRFPTIRKAIER